MPESWLPSRLTAIAAAIIGTWLANCLYCGANSDSDEGELTVRILVPIIALVIGAVFVLAMLKPPADQPGKQAQDTTQVDDTQTPTPQSESASDDQASLVNEVKKTVQTITDQPNAKV